MSYLIPHILAGHPITDDVLENELYEICDREHSSCNHDCPVSDANGGEAPDTAHDFSVNRGCDCFKNGAKMLQFLRAELARSGNEC